MNSSFITSRPGCLTLIVLLLYCIVYFFLTPMPFVKLSHDRFQMDIHQPIYMDGLIPYFIIYRRTNQAEAIESLFWEP